MPFSTADPNAYVALAMQSALGTPNTTPAKYRFAKYAGGNSFQDAMNVVDLREGGDGLDFGSSYQTDQSLEGTLVFNLRPEISAQVLAIAMGGATWTGGSLAPTCAHLFHTNHASFPWSTMQVGYPGTSLVRLVRDVKFTGLSFSFKTGQPLQMSLPYRGIYAGASTNIALVPSYPNLDGFWVYHFNPTFLVDGALATTLEEVRIDMNYGSENLQSQAVTFDDIAILNRDANITIVRRYEDATLYKKIYYGGGVAPTVSVPTGAFSGFWSQGGGGSQYTFKIDAGLITYRGDQLPDLDPDGKTVRETITGKILKTASSLLTVQVVNARASAITS